MICPNNLNMSVAKKSFYGPNSQIGPDAGPSLQLHAPEKELRRLVDDLLSASDQKPEEPLGDSVSRAAEDKKRPRAPLGLNMGLLNAEALERDQKRKLERTRELLAQKAHVVQQLVVRVQDGITEKRYPNTLQKLERHRLCLQCGKVFQRRAALGRWQCRRHTDQPDIRVNRWRCCGMEYHTGVRAGAPEGCTDCDHSDKQALQKGHLAFSVLDPELLKRIEPPLVSLKDGPAYEGVQPTRWAAGIVVPLVSKKDWRPDSTRPVIYEGMADHEVMLVPKPQVEPYGIHFPSRYWYPEEGEGGVTTTTPTIPAPKKQKQPQWYILTSNPNGPDPGYYRRRWNLEEEE
jgi:hypothetical protein